jgi:hypothetical protein
LVGALVPGISPPEARKGKAKESRYLEELALDGSAKPMEEQRLAWKFATDGSKALAGTTSFRRIMPQQWNFLRSCEKAPVIAARLFAGSWSNGVFWAGDESTWDARRAKYRMLESMPLLQ